MTVAGVPWARHGSRLTRDMENTVAWLACRTAKMVLVALLRITWRTVGAIVDRVVAEDRARKDPFDGLRRIGIDEISYKRGHRYLMVVVDHDTGRLVWAGKDRTKTTLREFFDELGEKRCDKIRLVSADAAEFIGDVVAERCQKAILCTDPFHVVKVRHEQLTAGGGLTSRTETWGYNLADQLIRHEPLWYDPAVANAETWSYDPLDGELVESTVGSTADGSFRAARYQRYNTGAVRSVCFDDDPTPEADCGDGSSIPVSWEYNAVGDRTRMVDPRGETTYVYGDGVNLTERSEPNSTVTSWTWNQNSGVDTLTYPDGAQARYGYYEDGAVEYVDYRASGGGTWARLATYTLDADGRVTTEAMAAGRSRGWTFEDGYPVGYTQNVDGTVTNTAMSYDRAGRLAYATVAGGHTSEYRYDIAGQLTAVIGSNAGAADDWAYSYYDGGLRRTQSNNGANWTYTYNLAGQLTQSVWVFWATTYGWDRAGRLELIDAGDNDVTTSYDPRGLVASVEQSTSGYSDHTRTYNGDGHLLTATVDNGTQRSEYDNTGWDLSPVRQNLSVTVETTQGGNTTVDTSRAVYGTTRLVADSPTGGQDWFAYDHLGNTIDTATYNTANSYSPFGEPASSPKPIYFGYRGEMHMSNELHLRARQYDMKLGIFNTPDPLDGQDGTPTAANSYHYADNDPINKTDPLGLRPECLKPTREDSSEFAVDQCGGQDTEAALGSCGTAVVAALADTILPIGDTAAIAICGGLIATAVVGTLTRAADQAEEVSEAIQDALDDNGATDEALDDSSGSKPKPVPIDKMPGGDERHRCAPQTGADDCGLPVFMPGGDTPDTTAHIVDALASNPGWSVLTRAEHPDSTTNRTWYQGDERCAGEVGDALSCDQYPFYTSRQGGPGASLRLVPGWEQNRQGGFLRNFYAACGIGQGDNYAVAPMPSQPATTFRC